MDDLISRGASIKTQIDQLVAELKDVNKQIADAAEFKPGSKTGHLFGGGYRVKVVKRDNIKWDQDKLHQVISNLPHHLSCFKTELTPVAKSVKAASDPVLEEALEWACIKTPGSPTVTYEPIDTGEEIPF